MIAQQPAEADEASLISWQMGRPPRTPWRVARRCSLGFPMAIASPSRLDDGTPFPSLYWLTCPWITERVSALESAGGSAAWAERVQVDPELAAAVKAADAAVRVLREHESGGVDKCVDVGLAGQSDPLGVKCLHAHVALALAGVADPIGVRILADLLEENRGASGAGGEAGGAAGAGREALGVTAEDAAAGYGRATTLGEEELVCPDERCVRRTA